MKYTEMKHRILNGELKIEDLINMTSKDFMSEEEKQK